MLLLLFLLFADVVVVVVVVVLAVVVAVAVALHSKEFLQKGMNSIIANNCLTAKTSNLNFFTAVIYSLQYHATIFTFVFFSTWQDSNL